MDGGDHQGEESISPAGRHGELESLKPPPLPSRAPSSPTATHPATTRSTGSRSDTSTVRAERDAPLIDDACRGVGELRRVEQEERLRLGEPRHGHVERLPVLEGRWRTGHCGRPGSPSRCRHVATPPRPADVQRRPRPRRSWGCAPRPREPRRLGGAHRTPGFVAELCFGSEQGGVAAHVGVVTSGHSLSVRA